ncbi:MAG: hypothetical protein IJP31_09315 [Lachnospiraceae bacterium]|nr:hypothetical protein [Lachnospiraceae bacterium]
MKCQQCGGNIGIQDERCPYCQTPNPHYKQHRAEMFRYRKDYEKTKEEVISKSGRFAGFTVKLTLIAVLAFLDVLFIALAVNADEVAWFLESRQVSAETSLHREKLEEYEAKRDYQGFVAYYEEHSLYLAEELEDFSKVYYASCNYIYIYDALVDLGQEDDYWTDERRIEVISDNLGYFYDELKPREYEDASRYTGEHGRYLEELKEDMGYLLCAYAKITAEEAEDFPVMSDGRRQLAIERGLGLYAD